MVIVRPATQEDIGFFVRVLLLANIERYQQQEGWNTEAFLDSVRLSTRDEVQGHVPDSRSCRSTKRRASAAR